MTLEEVFAHPATLSTSRLRLRPVEMRDLTAMFSIKSDPEVTERYGNEPHGSVEQTRNWIIQVLDNRKKAASILWVISTDEADAIGSVCFWNFSSDFRTAELGYELNRSHWGQRIMSEALPAVVKYGFEVMDLHRIEADPLVTNEPSKKLLLKLGFKPEGTLRERVFFRGKFYDQLCFGLLKNEWNRAILGGIEK